VLERSEELKPFAIVSPRIKSKAALLSRPIVSLPCVVVAGVLRHCTPSIRDCFLPTYFWVSSIGYSSSSSYYWISAPFIKRRAMARTKLPASRGVAWRHHACR
jgi:hypothetical protein